MSRRRQALSLYTENGETYGMNYPVELLDQILDLARNKYEIALLDFLVNNSFLQKTSTPTVNIADYLKYYRLHLDDFKRAAESLEKRGLVQMMTHYKPNVRVTKNTWFIPMVQNVFDQIVKKVA